MLVASKNVWTLLEQGSKISSESRQWLGGKKRERRSDPLLRYMFEARNDDEHGLETSLVEVPGSTRVWSEFQVLPEGAIIEGTEINLATREAAFVGKSPSGEPARYAAHIAGVERKAPETRLTTVRDRGGNELNPPTAHLGADLSVNSPSLVATLNYGYLERLVDEAEQFVQ
jgi:hypothetical protein